MRAASTDRDIVGDTRAYESWLAGVTELVEADLAAKHQAMATDLFAFMRATFYRFATTFAARCPDLADTPGLLSAGDVHVENFGTWRDAEGRLVWGINDVDEAATMPYAVDLVRLATSALLSPHTGIGADAVAESLLAGYGYGLRAPAAFVLGSQHEHLTEWVRAQRRDPARFWRHLTAGTPLEPGTGAQRAGADRAQAALPAGTERIRRFARRAGLGSLGRVRAVGLGTWDGGPIAREAKALAPSAWSWAHGQQEKEYSAQLLAVAVRSPDPHLELGTDGWLVRRLAPDATRLELAAVSNPAKLLVSMGHEVANFHAHAPDIAAVQQDLDARPAGWLATAAHAAAAAIEADWRDWR